MRSRLVCPDQCLRVRLLVVVGAVVVVVSVGLLAAAALVVVTAAAAVVVVVVAEVVATVAVEVSDGLFNTPSRMSARLARPLAPRAGPRLRPAPDRSSSRMPSSLRRKSRLARPPVLVIGRADATAARTRARASVGLDRGAIFGTGGGRAVGRKLRGGPGSDSGLAERGGGRRGGADGGKA